MRKVIFLLLVVMTSCELIVDVKVPYDGDKLVVNGIQQSDSAWAIQLSRSKYILEPGYFPSPVYDGDVVIHSPDGTSETLVAESDGYFVGTGVAETGKQYRITASAYGLDPVEGTMKMPERVKIIDVVWDSTRIEPNNSVGGAPAGRVPFTITFADPGGESNYYDINVYLYTWHSYTNQNGEQVIDSIGRFCPTYLQDPGIFDGDDQSEFTDRTFDGQTRTISLITEFVVWPGMTHYRTEVWLTTSGEDYYKFQETRALQNSVRGDPFAQPVQVYSNMSNSFGIFVGTATDVKSWAAPPED